MLITNKVDMQIASDNLDKAKSGKNGRGRATDSTDVKECSSNDCGFWSELPDDLLVEILCGLHDHNHLIRLKCVCRSWKDIITNVCLPKLSASSPLSGFIYIALRVKGQPFTEYIPYATPPEVVETTEFANSFSSLLPFDPAAIDFLDCCNGLLLFAEGSIPQYYVCNPMTKQCVAIPRDITRKKSSFAALAFNPSESPHYKVVSFVYSRSCPLRFCVFSSETGKWASHETPLRLPSVGHRLVRRCVYVDGVLYRQSCSKVLLCFDLNEVRAYAIELPEKERTENLGCIGFSRGQLYYSNVVGAEIFIWLLEDRHKINKWSLTHSFCINYLAEHQHPQDKFLCKSAFEPYALHPTSEVIFVGSPRMLLSYNLEDKRLEVVSRMGKDKFILWGQDLVFPYRQCPVNLNDFLQENCGLNQLYVA